MVITVILYMTADHITAYEVTVGSISGNYRYTALALKSETVINAPYSGSVTYYARDRARASKGTTICTIQEYAALQRTSVSSGGIGLTDDEYADLSEAISPFSLNYHESNFHDVYNFKNSIQSYLLQIWQTASEVTGTLSNQITSTESGFISFAVDGMEALKETDITGRLFNRNSYSVDNLRVTHQSSVKAGEPLYKIVTGEEWQLYFPIPSSLVVGLAEHTWMEFRFLRDDATFTAPFEIIQNQNEYFGKLTLQNSLVRYISDRYLEIELIIDSPTGLKVPKSAIVYQTFYKIPSEYAIVNEDTEEEITLLREAYHDNGSSTVSYVTATVYDKRGNDYLVSTDLFNPGDYVLMPDSSRKKMIKGNPSDIDNNGNKDQEKDTDLVKIEGVYNINKGYAVFREVTIDSSNKEFCIVRQESVYGLAVHDYIVLDASKSHVDDIINH